MASVINTNIASLTAQRNLSTNQASLATSMQRLSSGLRINSAKDDAAGLAISDRMTTQIRGLNQASRNANDGISLSQTAEGALGEVTNNLQRIRELAVQSANSTNSVSDRAALNQEVQQRLAEIDRVASQTSFNGQKVLDGSFANATFQVGANVGDTISIALSTSMRRSAIGAIASVASTIDLKTLASPTPQAATLTTVAITPTDFSTTTATPATKAMGVFTAGTGGDGTSKTINTFTVGTNVLTVTATGIDAAASAAGFTGAGFAADGTGTVNGFTLSLGSATTIVGAITAGSLTVNRVDGANFTRAQTVSGTAFTTAPAFAGPTIATTNGVPASTAANKDIVVGGTTITLNSNITTAAALVTAINAGLTAASNTTVTASVGATTGTVVFTSTAKGATAGTPAAPSGAAATSLGITGAGTTVAGVDKKSVVLAAGDLSVAIGSGTAVNVTGTFSTPQSLADAVNTAMAGKGYASVDATTGLMSISSGESLTLAGSKATTLGLTAATTAVGGSLNDVTVDTAANANKTIQRIDVALGSVSTLRSTFGAIQNRFDSVISSLSTTSENMSAARSRVQDADFAAETANLSRSQILQQAGTAMVAQANQLPQGVLALLR